MIDRHWSLRLILLLGGSIGSGADHSVTSAVSGPTCDYIVKLVREHGRCPLNLGEFEEAL
ncbi:MAG: hypothetical protein ABR915_15735 [Thermoguttaceae bacterium]|jgi:hypothetical protein